ncbi:hypothetical protein J437_LFUL013144 [Ladona fulva]|uniref:Phorbol-ester/DAG-type domain-containing protein n=1 Tax=Ladona fulva TaxID=123851 RepID=A0A8K0P5I0_LADFU|nr:hypothetical protein J437_LFUL013144 [Ladona fulva]
MRGHTRQGLKCRICKLNVHVDCQEKALGSKCQAKSRLLRRQKSTSEIETVPQHHRGNAGDAPGDDEKSDVQPPSEPSSSSSRRRRIFAGMRSLSVFQQGSGGGGSGSNSPKTAPGSPLRRGFFQHGGAQQQTQQQRQRASRHSHARSISLPENPDEEEGGDISKASVKSSSGRRPASTPTNFDLDPLATRPRPFGQPLFLTSTIPDEDA